MAMTAQRQKNYGNKYVVAPSIASDFIMSLVMAVNKAMMTTIANAIIPVAATPKTVTYSSVIDPYND